ncbi:SanA protein [Gillisia sp. Hel1_33_143]|nr:SanA protein [Gillisia sp. Hel1_33_143]
MLFLGGVLAMLVIFGIHAYIKKDTSSMLIKNMQDIPETTTAIVLGASVHSDGKLSPILKDRVDTSYLLYESGKVENFLLSGDHTTDDYDEVNSMKNYLLGKGVPQNKITLDHAGLDTYDSMYRSKALFDMDSAIVITQSFHLPRSLFIAKHLGLNYKGFAAKPQDYKATQQIIFREKLANIKAIWELVINAKPTTLKKRI